MASWHPDPATVDAARARGVLVGPGLSPRDVEDCYRVILGPNDEIATATTLAGARLAVRSLLDEGWGDFELAIETDGRIVELGSSDGNGGVKWRGASGG